MTEYRCHIQHVYTAEVLAEAHFDKMEQLLRAAERSVNERAEICRQMAIARMRPAPPMRRKDGARLLRRLWSALTSFAIFSNGIGYGRNQKFPDPGSSRAGWSRP